MTENEAIKEVRFNMSRIGLKESSAKRVTEAREVAIQALEEIQQYRAIGTIEEFKALKEKSLEKKPIYSDFDENEAGEIIPYKAVCPICGHEFEFGTWNDEENHHCVCGQSVDWSE